MSAKRRGSIYLLLLGVLMLAGYAVVTTAQESDLFGVSQQRIEPVASAEPVQGDAVAAGVCEDISTQPAHGTPSPQLPTCDSCQSDNWCKNNCCGGQPALCQQDGTCRCCIGC